MIEPIIDFLGDNAGIIGLLFFFILFCIFAVYTLRPGAKKKMSEYANIPLKDEDCHE